MILTSQLLPGLQAEKIRLEGQVAKAQEAYSINKTSSAAYRLRTKLKKLQEELDTCRRMIQFIKNRNNLSN